ncbi:opt oligopeptide transporter [Phaffia rhodozyma]|uniref:Opt oligopeptide transporter n=1 Tax=Phaffia rhodozyma TaxID=264483 RepID=A0A0F7SGW0_PHARH|nr:opt oligopeptide transporter [Phaffia rhodozyma]
MNYFKSYGVMSCYNAIAFAQDLKLAHYMKIPQRHTFAVQIYGAIIATFVSTAVLNWQMTLEDVCTTSQKQHFYCNGEATFFTATVFWGTLGPGRVFGAGGIYTSLLYGFLVGAVLPLPFYFLARKYPKSLWAKVHVVVLISGGINWNPYVTIGNYWPQVVIGWFFLVYIKKKYLAWWSKYNYILATAFASAIPLCGILIFGIISSTSADDVVGDWSVNTIYQESCDYLATSSTNKYPECRKYKIPAVGYFGAAPGSGAWD